MKNHLNLFQHYDHQGTLPIENNISRGLAIILQEYPMLLDMLIDCISTKERQHLFQIEKPIDTYEISFQRKADDFDYHGTIIGIALTSSELAATFEDEVGDLSKYNPITDITISYDDTLIFVEVKRNNADCIFQLREQMEKYKAVQKIENEDIISIKWEDIVLLLERFKSLSAPNQFRIVNDYYDHLSAHFPDWLPSYPLGKTSFSEAARIDKRMNVIKSQIKHELSIKDDSDIAVQHNNIPIDFGWASEFNVWCDNIEASNKSNEAFILGIWPCAIGHQSWKLISTSTTMKFAQRLSSSIITESGLSVNVLVTPYFELKSWRKPVMSAPFSRGFDNTKEYKKFVNNFVRRWKKTDWDEFYKMSLDSNRIYDVDRFKENFSSIILNSGKTQFDLSVVFRVYAWIPYELVQKIDVDDKSFNNVAKMSIDILRTLKRYIEA